MRQILSISNDSCLSIALDEAKNPIVLSKGATQIFVYTTQNTVKFTCNPVNAGSSNLLALVKYSNDYNTGPLWAATFDLAESSGPTGRIAVTSDGSVSFLLYAITAVTFNKTQNDSGDIDPTVISLGTSSTNFACLIKFNSAGVLQWKQLLTAGTATANVQELSVVNDVLYLTIRITAGPFSCNGVASFLTSANAGTILLRGTSAGVFSLLSYTVI